VITKLFNLVMPTRAYFGKKDAQQVAIIEGLITDLNIPVKIVPVDIVREKDGLAKSSRNVHLSFEDRKQATILYKSLQAAKKAVEDGESNPDHIVNIIKDLISTAPNAKVDYVDILTYPQLEPLEKLDGRFIIALAVRFSKIRLIDNMIFEGTRED
jgi:pantoate--beta-alanine ligase